MASSALGEALVQAVFDDWRTAPIGEALRATLGVVRLLTLSPMQVTSAEIDHARANGASADQIREAIYICGMFNMIVRLADAPAPDVPHANAVARRRGSEQVRGNEHRRGEYADSECSSGENRGG